MLRKLALMTLVALLPTVVLAQKPKVVHRGGTTKFYSQNGRPQGRSVQHGNRTHFYDQRGRPQGWAVQHGKTMRFYSQNGRPQGQAVRVR